MQRHVFLHLLEGAVGVAVLAKVGATVVPADVARGDAQTPARISRVPDGEERAAVGAADSVQRIAAAARNAQILKRRVRLARLKKKAVFLRNGDDGACKCTLLLVLGRNNAGKARPHGEEGFQKADDAAAHKWRNFLREPSKPVDEPRGGVFLGEKDGGEPPEGPLPSHLRTEFFERPDALRLLRDVGLQIAPERRDGIMKEGVIALRDLKKA